MSSSIEPSTTVHTANLVVPGSDLGPSLRVAAWVLVGLSGAFLGTRLYCKWRRHRTIHLDDGFLVAAWVMLNAAVICTTIEISYGFGKPTATLIAESRGQSAADFVTTLNSITLTGQLAITFGICAQAWSKTSWAITLLRIASGWRRLRGFVWFALVSMNLFFACPAFGYWLQCQPVAKAWQPLLPGTCWNPQVGVVLGIVASCKFCWSLPRSFFSSFFLARVLSSFFAVVVSVLLRVTLPTMTALLVFASLRLADPSRLLRPHGSRLCHRPLAPPPPPPGQPRRKTRHRRRHEHGRLRRHLGVHQIVRHACGGVARLFV